MTSADRVRSLIALRRGQDAVAEAQRLVARDPDHPEWLRLLAEAHLVAEAPAEALRWADRAVAAAPDHPWGHVLRAQAHRGNGTPALAVVAARRGVAVAPFNVGAATVLAQSLADAGDRDEARRAAHRLVELAPTAPESYGTLGYVLHGIAPQEARAAYHECLRLDPQNALARQNLAALDVRSAPFAAMDGLAASLAIDPTLRVARTNLDRVLKRWLGLVAFGGFVLLRLLHAAYPHDTIAVLCVVLAAVVVAVLASLWRMPRTVRRALGPFVFPRWSSRGEAAVAGGLVGLLVLLGVALVLANR